MLKHAHICTCTHIQTYVYTDCKPFILPNSLSGVVYLHRIVGVAHCLLSSHAVQFSPKGCAKVRIDNYILYPPLNVSCPSLTSFSSYATCTAVRLHPLKYPASSVLP